MNIIECNNLTHYYGKRCIYKDLNFTVKKGKIVGLLGKNGTGKTTTINILNGYLTPKSGECKIFGENSMNLSPEIKAKIGLLIEGHVQYGFMNVKQIEKYYSAFFKNWNKDVYYDLVAKLKITENQKINTMSCGQRSQVALGLILAQNAELFILDDFSMGLDPGYRTLFVDFLKDYALSEEKTVFVTSHIIQDMERLIDECLILDYGKILIQKDINELMNSYKCYSFTNKENLSKSKLSQIANIEEHKDFVNVFSFENKETIINILNADNYTGKFIKEQNLTLEQIFMGLRGKY